jgi:GNAT superfamily N-acetyltransferase
MFTVNEISLGLHAADVEGLWQRNLADLSDTDLSKKLRLGYLENPAGEGLGLALKGDGSDAMVGVICLHPRSMYHGATALRSANMADFAVEPSFRTLGPALLLMKEAVALAGRRDIFLYGLPNRNSAAVCRRAGLNVLEGGQLRYARALTGNHPRVQGLPPAVAMLVKPVIGLALRMAEAWRALTLKPRLHCTATTFDDPAIDALWARRPQDLLLGERSNAMMRWRYGLDGRGDWNVTLVRTTSGEPVGMVVWRKQGGAADFGDFFSIDPAHLTAPMINAFCRFVRPQGVHSVSLTFFGSQAVIDQLTRAGLRSRGEASAVVLDATATNVPELVDVERWYLTAFDSDAN